MHSDKNNDKFWTFYCIWAYWSLIESLTQFDEIFWNFPNLSMFRILSITFATDLRLTWSLCHFVDNSKIYKLCEQAPDQIRDCKVDKISLQVGVRNLDSTLSENIQSRTT